MARLIGTAGHVDHGKTTLIQALTGINADRLPEEKKRGMTIDIGFAYIDLPEVGRVSIVDVPGHEKFIHNMLVGALGIDVALLCVAADEGVMPQTREHFEIIQLLPVEQMVVALTRSDLADSETRSLVEMEVRELLSGTRFQDSPAVEVSATTGEGLEELKSTLDRLLKGAEGSSALTKPWYLPIDRAFAAKGHGVVVTGTLAQGQVRQGDSAQLIPGSAEVRIRSIQTHDEIRDQAEHGMRVALNLGGVKLEEVHRGMAVGAFGAIFETTIVDARIKWIVPPKHNQRVRVSIGADEVMAKAFLNDQEPELVQLRLESPVAAAIEQPVIIRRYSPMELMGGGRVVTPMAKPRRKSEKATMVVTRGSEPDAILAAVGDDPNGTSTEEVCRRLGRTPQALGSTFETLLKEERIHGFAGQWLTPEGYQYLKEILQGELQLLHDAQPMTAAHARESVFAKARLKWSGKCLDRLLASLAQDGLIVVSGTTIRLSGFKVKLSDKQQAFLTRVIAAIEAAGLNVPSVTEVAKAIPAPIPAVEEILRLGMNTGEILRIADGLYYSRHQIETIESRLRETFAGRPFPASEFRDIFQTSRKYTIPLLEFFDSNRVTLRQGDLRTVQ